MPYTPVQSTNLRGVDYDPSSQIMTVDFHNSRSYRYANVPQEAYDALCSADSVGKHFNQFIKNSFEQAL